MALMQLVPSPEVEAAYITGLQDATGSAPGSMWSYYVRVDTLSLDDLANARGVSAARDIGSRFSTAYAPDGPLTCDMTSPSAGGTPRLRNLVKGEHPQRLLDAVKIAHNLPIVKANDYELRILCIPALQMEAIRLKPVDATQPEFVIPILSMEPSLQEMVSCSLDQCMSSLLPRARERINFDDSLLKDPQAD
jgi:hypothetical protein